MAALALALAAAAPAPARAGEGRPPFLSDWGRRVLGRCHLAAEGRLDRSWSLPCGGRLTLFRVEKVLWGEEDRPTVMVLTPDPHYFRGAERCLLFLRRLSGSRYEPRDLLDLSAEGSDRRLAHCKALLEVETLPTHMERVALFKELVLGALDDADPWIRRHAVRETFLLSKERPGLFTRADGERVRELLRRGGGKEHGRYLLSIRTHLLVLPPLERAVQPRKEGDTVRNVEALRALLSERGLTDRERRFREEAIFDRFREEEDYEVRSRILRIVGFLRSPRLANGVIRALFLDPSPTVRVTAAQVLGRFSGPTVVSFLCRALDDSLPRVRTAVLASLEALGDPAARPAVQALLEDEGNTEDVRRRAREVLESLPDRK